MGFAACSSWVQILHKAAPCWPAESLALPYIAAARAEIMSCCNGRCTAAALNLHRCPLFLPTSGGRVAPVLCTTRLVTGGGQRPATCAQRRAGVKSLLVTWPVSHRVFWPRGGYRCAHQTQMRPALSVLQPHRTFYLVCFVLTLALRKH